VFLSKLKLKSFPSDEAAVTKKMGTLITVGSDRKSKRKYLPGSCREKV